MERQNRVASIFFSIILLLSLATSAFAESSVWKAQKGNYVLYLGGTFHMLREADYPLPPEFEKAYRASAMVVFETDIGKFQEASTQEKLLAKATYQDGSSLEQHLSPKVYQELDAYCEANDIALEFFSRLRPSVVATALVLTELRKLGVTERGVDQYYYQLAHRDKKGVKGLETVDQQIDYVVTMADGIEDDFISYTIKDLKSTKAQFDSLAAAWRKGDTGKLHELMLDEVKSRQPKLYKKLFLDRNNNWLAQIENWRKTPQVRFILVGAAHLAGPDGLIEGLKKKGYKVDKL